MKQTFRRWRLQLMKDRIAEIEGKEAHKEEEERVREWARKTSIAIFKIDNKLMDVAD